MPLELPSAKGLKKSGIGKEILAASAMSLTTIKGAVGKPRSCTILFANALSKVKAQVRGSENV